MKWLVVAGSVTEAAMTILNDTGEGESDCRQVMSPSSPPERIPWCL